MLESLNYSFRNPKNIVWVIYRIKQLRNYKKKHGVLRGPQLGKQRWRARLGILRVNFLAFSNNGVFRAKSYTCGGRGVSYVVLVSRLPFAHMLLPYFVHFEYLCVPPLDGRGGTDSCRTDSADFRHVRFRSELNLKSPRWSPSVSANETTFGNHERIVK